MAAPIQSIFNIRAGEGAKVLQFALLGTLIWTGFIIGYNTAYSLFLNQVGAEKLPYIYMLTLVVMLCYVPLNAYLTERFGLDQVFSLAFGLLVAAGGIFSYLVSVAESREWIYYLVILYPAFCYNTLYTLYWNFTDNFFDIQDSKRLYSIFSGGMALGGILGGALLTVLSDFLPVGYFFLIWSALALVTYPLYYRLRRREDRIEEEEEEEQVEENFVHQLAQTLTVIKGSRYILIFIAILFTTLILTTICEYQYNSIFEKETSDAQTLASLLGKLSISVNIFNLLINLFVFNRLVLYLGVRNVALIQPCVYLATFSYFFLDYGLYAAYFGYFAYQGYLTSIEYNNQNFLYNGIASDVKVRVRVLIESLCEPLATALAGAFLLVWSLQLTPEEKATTAPVQLSSIGLGGAALLVLLVLALRSDYLRAMVTNLRGERLDFSIADDRALRDLQPAEIQLLENRIRAGGVTAALETLPIVWLNDRLRALEILLDVWRSTAVATRADLQPLMEMVLADEDFDIISRLFEELASDEILLDYVLLEELSKRYLIQPQLAAPLLDSNQPTERAVAAMTLWNSWKLGDNILALQEIDELLQNGRAAEAALALKILGRSNQRRFSHFIVPYLNHADPNVRREALGAISRLADRGSTRLVEPVLEKVAAGDPVERTLAMDVLAQIKDVDCIVPLLKQGHLFTRAQRRKAEVLVQGIGLRSVPGLASLLSDATYPYASRSIAAHALAKISFPQFEALFTELIHAEIVRAYTFFYRSTILRPHQDVSPGIFVLAKFYQDTPALIVDFILELLAIGGRIPDFELISTSLRSQNPKERGNAIETTEQGVDRSTFKILLPLIRSRGIEEKIEFYRTHFPATDLEMEQVVAQALQNPLPLESAAAAQALWDLQGTAAAEGLRQQLQNDAAPLLKEVIVHLFGKNTDSGRLTAIEKMDYLARCDARDLIDHFDISELELLGGQAREIELPAGEAVYRRGDSADALFCIISGTVHLGVGQTKGAGQLFGEEAVYGIQVRKEDAMADALHALVISRELLAAANIHPQTTIKLIHGRLRTLTS